MNDKRRTTSSRRRGPAMQWARPRPAKQVDKDVSAKRIEVDFAIEQAPDVESMNRLNDKSPPIGLFRDSLSSTREQENLIEDPGAGRQRERTHDTSESFPLEGESAWGHYSGSWSHPTDEDQEHRSSQMSGSYIDERRWKADQELYPIQADESLYEYNSSVGDLTTERRGATASWLSYRLPVVVLGVIILLGVLTLFS